MGHVEIPEMCISGYLRRMCRSLFSGYLSHQNNGSDEELFCFVAFPCVPIRKTIYLPFHSFLTYVLQNKKKNLLGSMTVMMFQTNINQPITIAS
uniref:Uncharacterized protein n=1 Tax=Anguilla anguilla TaxID=7936 RepID=A0A0E9XR06_ANGAN